MKKRKSRGGRPSKCTRVTIEEYEGPQAQIEVSEWHNHDVGISRQNYHIDIPSSPDLPPTLNCVSQPAPDITEPFDFDEDAYFNPMETEIQVEDAAAVSTMDAVKVSTVESTVVVQF